MRTNAHLVEHQQAHGVDLKSGDVRLNQDVFLPKEQWQHGGIAENQLLSLLVQCQAGICICSRGGLVEQRIYSRI